MKKLHKNKSRVKPILLVMIVTIGLIIFLKFQKHNIDSIAAIGQSKIVEYPLLAPPDVGSILTKVSSEAKETNSLDIEISEYRFSYKDAQVILAKKEKNFYYALDRAVARIVLLELDDKGRIQVKRNYSLGKLLGGALNRIYLMGMVYGDHKLYISMVRYSSFDDNVCPKVELFEFDDDLKNSKVIFSSSPCLADPPYHEIGAQLALSSNYIYIVGGNRLLDLGPVFFPSDIAKKCCKNKTFSEALNMTNLLGKTVRIDRKTYSYETISQGHRSPQGLFYDRERGVLWETENGPRGGDELNIIKTGRDYGWPQVTLGEPYDQIGNLGTRYNSHKLYERPYYSWTPSVSPSQLGVINKSDFVASWSENLIAGSLKDKSLYRFKLDDSLVLSYVERIYVGERIRSIAISYGNIVMGTDTGKIMVIKPILKNKPKGLFPATDYGWPSCAFNREDFTCQ